jgi:tRNA-2-methylthio-N6-dimethylallyladenosine synthase
MDQVPEAVKHERFNRLVELLNQISAEKNAACIGQVLDVLVEGQSKTNSRTLAGRTESGKLVNFKGTPDLVGQIVPIKITEGKTFSLFGDIL